MTQSGFFITGTDTNIGKTVVSTILTLGLNATYWKPIQTGSIEGTDREFVERWARNQTWPESCVFSEPASPHLAASHAGQSIDIQKIKDEFLKLPEKVIIEGAGGALVPINDSMSIADLISAISLPAVIVSSTRLGTINHTLLTLEALHRRSVPVAGFITIGEKSPEIAKTIEHFSRSRSLGHIPTCRSFSLSWFEEAFRGLDIPQILKGETKCHTASNQ